MQDGNAQEGLHDQGNSTLNWLTGNNLQFRLCADAVLQILTTRILLGVWPIRWVGCSIEGEEARGQTWVSPLAHDEVTSRVESKEVCRIDWLIGQTNGSSVERVTVSFLFLIPSFREPKSNQ
jgi:hypothetical protein